MIVLKFGGTSVADLAAIDRAVSIVRSRLARGPYEPTPIGVFRDVQKPTYEDLVSEQVAAALDGGPPARLP